MTAAVRLSLRELAEKAMATQEEGAVAAETAIEGQQLSTLELDALAQMARIDKATEAALKELKGANEKILSNPYGRRDWLRMRILGLLADESYDPEEVLTLISAAVNPCLPNGKPAFNLFTATPIRDRKNLGSTPIYPFARANLENDSKKLVSSAPWLLTATTNDDAEALQALWSVRDKVAESIIKALGGESLVNFRRVIRQALYFFNQSRLLSKAELDASYEGGEDGVIRHVDSQRPYNFFVVSNQEIFIVPETERSTRLVDKLNELQEYAKDFWAGQINMEEIVRDLVRENPEKMIDPKDFCDGHAGLVAIHYDKWRKDGRNAKKTIRIVVLFQRLVGDTRWRWALCNQAGIKELFSGEGMRFHEFTNEPIPLHMRYLLMNGKVF